MKSVESYGSQPDTFISPDRKHEIDVARQQLVIDSLRKLRKTDVQELPDITSGLDRDGNRFSDFNTDLFEPGLYVSPELKAQVFPKGKTPNRMQFTPKEILRIGRDNSTRQVFFGEVQLDYFEGKQKETVVTLAFKAFEEGISKQAGLQEMAVAQYLDSRGVDVIQPAGLLVTEEDGRTGTFFLLSIFDPNVKTLDNLDWKNESEETVIRRIDGAVDAAADIHTNLIFQGDLQFKNIAVRQTKGDYLTIDHEFSVSTLNDVNRKNTARTEQCMSTDLGDIVGSVKSLVCDERYDPGSRDEVFEWMLGYVYLPYRRHLVEKDGPHTPMLLNAFAKMIEKKAEMEERLRDIPS